MSSIRKNTYVPALTLREFKSPVIAVVCGACNRRGELDRKALVRQLGADLTFVQLRRRVAMGCSWLVGEDGADRCETHFPGLIAAGLSLNKEDQL